MKTSMAVVITAAFIILISFLLFQQAKDDIHWHFDFALYIDGSRYNFSQEKYMASNNTSLSNFAHFHDMNGNVIHKHHKDVTFGFFFRTLGMELNSTCLVLDDKRSYCGIKMFVNEKESRAFDKYNIQDLDRILIVAGEVKEYMMESVTSDACIYSFKCPEKGAPPDEASCTGSCVYEEI